MSPKGESRKTFSRSCSGTPAGAAGTEDKGVGSLLREVLGGGGPRRARWAKVLRHTGRNSSWPWPRSVPGCRNSPEGAAGAPGGIAAAGWRRRNGQTWVGFGGRLRSAVGVRAGCAVAGVRSCLSAPAALVSSSEEGVLPSSNRSANRPLNGRNWSELFWAVATLARPTRHITTVAVAILLLSMVNPPLMCTLPIKTLHGLKRSETHC